MEVQQRTAIDRLQVEGGDFVAFLHLARDAEAPRAAPAAGRRGALGVNRFLGIDQHIGQLLIGRAPGVEHFLGGDFLAEYFANCPQQAGTNDGIVFRKNLQRHMLVDDLRHQRAELLQLVDVPGIHQHAVGQRALLVAGCLVGLVEQRAHFRVLAEHQLVEVPGQRFAASLQQGYGGLDQCTVFVRQHVDLLWNARHRVVVPWLFQEPCHLQSPVFMGLPAD
ncbi:hypothetical protein D3C76_859940 [compost metagenome]